MKVQSTVPVLALLVLEAEYGVHITLLSAVFERCCTTGEVDAGCKVTTTDGRKFGVADGKRAIGEDLTGGGTTGEGMVGEGTIRLGKFAGTGVILSVGL